MIDEIKKLVEHRYAYSLFSGGRDSLVTLSLVKEACKVFNKKPMALYADTTMALPQNVDYIRKICDLLDVDLTVVSPREDIFTKIKKWGIPTIKARWCCWELKMKPIRLFLERERKEKGFDYIVFDGIRAEESPSRMKRAKQIGMIETSNLRGFKYLNCHPILWWKEKDVQAYINHKGLLVNPLYRKGIHGGECWCGVFQSKRQFMTLKAIDPELFDKLVEAEKSVYTGYVMLWRGKRTPLQELKKQQTLTEVLG